MKFFILLYFLIITGCGVTSNKVYMCGNRECIDKKEANEYFNNNLSLEIKIIDKKNKKQLNLVELNKNDKNININERGLPEDIIVGPIIKSIEDKFFKKNNIKKTNNELKILKEKIKNERKEAKIIEKRNKKISDDKKKLTKINENIADEDNVKQIKKSILLNQSSICENMLDCDIDKISEMLLKKGNDKEFPNIATK